MGFRFHLLQSKNTNGFLIVVEEKKGLGDGQKIEIEMARQVGVKVFRTYTNITYVELGHTELISAAVQAWYNSNGANSDLENVWIGNGEPAENVRRPKYERF